MTVVYVGDGNPDGTCLGQSTSDKVGFYGTAPSAKTTVTHTAAAGTAAVFSAAFTGMWAYASSTVAKARDLAIVQMSVAVTRLKAMGLI
jgi:hypothetical protein